MRLGAVAVPLNTRMGDDALQYVVDDAEAVGDDRRTRRWRSAPARLAARVPRVVARDRRRRARRRRARVRAPRSPTPRRRSSGAPPIPTRSACSPTRPDRRASRRACCSRTAARSGTPTCCARPRSRTTRSAALVAVPLFHKNAMAGAVKPFLLAGGSMVILPGFDARRGHPRDRSPPRDVSDRRPRDVQDDPGRDASARPHGRVERPLRDGRLGGGARGADRGVQARVPARRDRPRATGSPRADPVPVTNTRWGLKRRGSCGLAFPGCERRARSTRRAATVRRRGRGRADHPQPGPRQGLLEAARRDRAGSSATAGSRPAISCAATPTGTTTSSAGRTT